MPTNLRSGKQCAARKRALRGEADARRAGLSRRQSESDRAWHAAFRDSAWKSRTLTRKGAVAARLEEMYRMRLPPAPPEPWAPREREIGELFEVALVGGALRSPRAYRDMLIGGPPVARVPGAR